MRSATIWIAMILNFGSVVWTMATYFNGRQLGNVAFVSLYDVHISMALLAAAFIANLFLSIVLMQDGKHLRNVARIRASDQAERRWDVPCGNCGMALSNTMRFCTSCGQRNTSAVT